MRAIRRAYGPIWPRLALSVTLLCAGCAQCPSPPTHLGVRPVLPTPDPMLLEPAPTDQIERMLEILMRMRSGRPLGPDPAP